MRQTFNRCQEKVRTWYPEQFPLIIKKGRKKKKKRKPTRLTNSSRPYNSELHLIKPFAMH